MGNAGHVVVAVFDVFVVFVVFVVVLSCVFVFGPLALRTRASGPLKKEVDTEVVDACNASSCPSLGPKFDTGFGP
jgi:hypothetical protein